MIEKYRYKYGTSPVDLGLIDLNPNEMMFWLNLPIKVPFGEYCIPCKNLEQFLPIISRIREVLGDSILQEDYIYLTVKTLHVNKGSYPNRPGWHSDGFMTDDNNFIWYDTSPTVFWCPDEGIDIIQDHEKSLVQMQEVCSKGPFKTYPEKHLLMLDQFDLHKCTPAEDDGVRTFIKVSISKNKYDMEGNSVNHLLDLNWDYKKREVSRNLQSTEEMLK